MRIKNRNIKIPSIRRYFIGIQLLFRLFSLHLKATNIVKDNGINLRGNMLAYFTPYFFLSQGTENNCGTSESDGSDLNYRYTLEHLVGRTAFAHANSFYVASPVNVPEF